MGAMLPLLALLLGSPAFAAEGTIPPRRITVGVAGQRLSGGHFGSDFERYDLGTDFGQAVRGKHPPVPSRRLGGGV